MSRSNVYLLVALLFCAFGVLAAIRGWPAWAVVADLVLAIGYAAMSVAAAAREP